MRIKACTLQLLFNSALFKWVTAIGIGEEQGSAWPFGPHRVDGDVWKPWGICLCHHTRHTRGTRRELAV
jgi:hypothetical protein